MFSVSGEISVSPHQGLHGGEAGPSRSLQRLKESLFALGPSACGSLRLIFNAQSHFGTRFFGLHFSVTVSRQLVSRYSEVKPEMPTHPFLPPQSVGSCRIAKVHSFFCFHHPLLHLAFT